MHAMHHLYKPDFVYTMLGVMKNFMMWIGYLTAGL